MQAIRVVLTAILLGLFGLAGLFVNYSAPPSASPAIRTEDQLRMSNSISTLLTRNLQDVFGENDPARRRAAIDELFTEECVFYDPNKGVYRGRAEIDRIAGELRATHGDFRYQPIAEPEEAGNGGRVRWVEGRPGEAPAVAGTDFIIARDGRIAALYLFFDKLP
jgi:SnoaL-like domain